MVAPVSTVPAMTAPADASRRVVLIVTLTVLTALASAHIWFNIFHIPFQRPIAALFDATGAPPPPWVPGYIAPSLSALIGGLIFSRYFRRPERLSVVALAIHGLLGLLLGTAVAICVRTIGQAVYSGIGAPFYKVLVALPMIVLASLADAFFTLWRELPTLVLIASCGGALLGLLMGVPWRAPKVAPGQNGTERVARRWMVWLTALIVALIGGVGISTPMASLLVSPAAALTWAFLIFRGGRYDRKNLLLGSAVVAVLATVLAAIAITFAPGGSFDVVRITGGGLIRFLIFSGLSFLVMKVALRLSPQVEIGSS